MFKVLFCGDNALPGFQSLTRYLGTTGKFELDFSVVLPSPEYLAQFDVLVLTSEFHHSDENHSVALVRFVEAGGGLVCLGRAADSVAQQELLARTLGVTRGQRTPQTELIVRVPGNSGHPITNRLQAGYAHGLSP